MVQTVEGLVKTTTRFGHWMTVDRKDAIGRTILEKGIYDECGLDLILDVISILKPKVALDVGANIGNHTLPISACSEVVCSFEPNPEAFKLLQANVIDNELTNVKVFNVGLSEADANLPLYVDRSGNLGASTLRPESRLQGHEYEPREVILKQGDRWLGENGVGNVGFIKIGVEGHEAEVLKGLSETIKKCRPTVVLEWSEKSSDKDVFIRDQLISSIFDGYDVYGTYLNIDKSYWRLRRFGAFRRIVEKLFVGRRLKLVELNPATLKTSFRLRELFLIPSELQVSVLESSLLCDRLSAPRF